MINNLVLQCNAVKDTIALTSASLPMTKVRVACNEEKEGRETLFINAFFYGKSAENALKLITKGSPLLLVGRLVARSYQNKDGHLVTENQIAVERWQLLNKGDGSRGKSEEVSKPTSYEVPEMKIKDEDLPF